MRMLLGAAAVLAVGCGPGGGSVSLVLDIPNAMLDPKGYTSVEVRLHSASGDTELNVAIEDGTFDLGEIDVTSAVMIEAALRTESGAAVGYGRAAAPSDLRDGERIVIPVRRPIVYFAGLARLDQDGNPNTTTDVKWSRRPPTFSDLTAGTPLDGSSVLPENAVMTVAAGPTLFTIDQMPMDPTGVLVGTPVLKNVSTGDHTASAALPAMLSGAVLDAAGSDDGRQLLIGTSTQLFVVDTESGMAKPVADGAFNRVAIVSAEGGAMTAIAIRNRSFTTCTADLVWVAVNADDTNQVMTLATSGFSDVAGDVGRGFFIDLCNGGELGEATAAGVQSLRTGLGKPTALAVSNGQAWIGLERAASTTAPAGMALVSASLVGMEPPRTLFDEPATQVVEAVDFPGVQRELGADIVRFINLEVGAGGDYVATTLSAHYEGAAIIEANFPRIEIDSQELRVIAASTGAPLQRYRSWCEGVIVRVLGDIPNWGCATPSGQLAPANAMFAHRIHSMTFQYGKK